MEKPRNKEWNGSVISRRSIDPGDLSSPPHRQQRGIPLESKERKKRARPVSRWKSIDQKKKGSRKSVDPLEGELE